MPAPSRIVVVTGPTASGKNALAYELAGRFPLELVNGDSVQVVEDFSIGSCKPTPEELAGVAHHLYSAVSPEEHFDAARFVSLADAAIEEIVGRGSVPLIVGGTGLYIRSLLCGLVNIDSISESARTKVVEHIASIEEQYPVPEERGGALLALLESFDPETAARLHSSDRQRIVRALEVYFETGESLARLQDEHAHAERRYHALVIALLPPRELLYEAIDLRVQELFAAGLVEEVKELRQKYSPNCQAFSAIGYRQIVEMLDGTHDEAEALRLVQRDTRHFAKRQLTWWRNQPKRLGWNILPAISWGSDSISDKLTLVLREFLSGEVTEAEPEIAFLRIC